MSRKIQQLYPAIHEDGVAKLIEFKEKGEIWIDYAISGAGITKGSQCQLLIGGERESLEDDYKEVKGEDFIQMCFFDWLRKIASPQNPDFKFLHHVPNGGERTAREGAKMKRLGVKRGVPDCFWPYTGPEGEAGLYIEFKALGGHRTKFQENFQEFCVGQNYVYKLAYTPIEAINFVAEYYDKELIL
jgi:hypothetical protein